MLVLQIQIPRVGVTQCLKKSGANLKKSNISHTKPKNRFLADHSSIIWNYLIIWTSVPTFQPPKIENCTVSD